MSASNEQTKRGFSIYVSDRIAPPFEVAEGIVEASEQDTLHTRELASAGQGNIRLPIQHGRGDMPLPAWIEE